MHGALLWRQGDGHQKSTIPEENMCRTTGGHTDTVTTHTPTTHSVVVIRSLLHTYPPIHEGPLHYVSRTTM